MKISAKTMAAVERAAAKQKMSVDAWAEQVLARAASGDEASDINGLLREISRKIDRVADRQGFGEKANQQLAAAVDELGVSFNQMRKSTGRLFDQVRSRTGSAVSEMAEKAMDVIGQVSRSATELAGNLAPKAAGQDEAAPQSGASPTSRTTRKPRRKKSVRSGTSASRRPSPRRNT